MGLLRKLWGGDKTKNARRAQRRADLEALDAAGRALRGERDEQPIVFVGPLPLPVTAPVAPRLDPVAQLVVTRESTTERTPGTASQKTGDVLAPSYLEHVRQQPCAFCGRKGPSDPHHFPGKGALGMTVDLLVAPACRGPGTEDCHDRAQRYAISRGAQTAAVMSTLTAFLRRAPRDVKARVFTEIAAGLA